jgi:hypothetical protein
LLAQNGLYATSFIEQRCGTSVEMKLVEESRFQPIHKKDAAKKLSRVVGKLDRTAGTFFACLLAAKLFVTRKMRLLIGFRA